jgi:hypothetical protein
MKQMLLASTAAVALAFGGWGVAAQDRGDQQRAPSAATQDRGDQHRAQSGATQQRPADAERGAPSTQREPGTQPQQGQAQRDPGQNAPAAAQQRGPEAQPGQPRETAGERERGEKGAKDAQSQPAQPGQARSGSSGMEQQKSGTEPQKSGMEPQKSGMERQKSGTEPQKSGTEPQKSGTEPQKSGMERQKSGTERQQSGTEQQNMQAQPNQPRATGERQPGVSGSTTAPAAQPAERAGAGGGAPAQITQQQRVELNQRLASVNLQRVDRVDFSLNVGTVIPRSVRLYPLPAEIVAIVPAFRGYQYIAVGERVVIVEPRTLRIVHIIERGVQEGSVGSTAPPRASLEIQERTRAVIRERKVAYQRAPRSVNFQIEVGAVVPQPVQLHPIPQPIVAVEPDLRPYRYVVVEDQFVIVEPQARRILAVVPH